MGRGRNYSFASRAPAVDHGAPDAGMQRDWRACNEMLDGSREWRAPALVPSRRGV